MVANLSSVAALARVSTSTASRALSGHPSVLPATRERVLAAAAELQYHPNRIASALRTSRSGLLGLVVNNLRNGTSHSIADALQEWAAGHGYQVLVCTTGGDPDREAAFLRTVREHQLDGVVVAGSGENAALVNRLLEEGRAVVTMNRDVPGSRAPSVMTDYRTTARLATEHLLALGHTRIAAIEGPPDSTAGRLHHAGYVDAMAAAGVPVVPELVAQGPCSMPFGRAAVERLLVVPDPPTALLLSNQEAAFGALPNLVETGLRVPEELSVICTESEAAYSWWNPPLTMVDNRAEDQARRAATLLLAQLTGDGAATADFHAEVLEPRLVVRGSTGAPRRSRTRVG